MTQTITVSDLIPATPADIYAAWLDSMGHAAMTGGGKAEASKDVGGRHSAWDGYISGANLDLEPDARIVQSWRSTEFTPEDLDSTLTVLLEPTDGGTKVTLVHTGVPDQLADFIDGWREYYFEPMKTYFAALLAPPPMPVAAMEEPAAKKAPAKRPAARKTAARKPTAARKAPAKKPASARRAAAKKPVAARKTAAKKPATRKAAKTTGRKAPKRAAARKTAAKKVTAKKPSARKPAKRAAAKSRTTKRKTATRRRR